MKDRSLPVSGQTLDSILDQEFQSLCTGIQELMERQQIYYISQPMLPRLEATPNRLESTFSSYVSQYISPLPVQGYISTLCEKMSHMISSPAAPQYPVAPNDTVQPVLAPPPPTVAPLSATNAAPPTVTPADVLSSKQSASKTKSQESLLKAANKLQTPGSTPTPTPTPPPPAPKTQLSPTRKSPPGKKTDANVAESSKCTLPLLPEVLPEPAQVGAQGTEVIGQIKPDVLCTLMEIMQMNTVRFYIQRGDEEENELCTEIKVGFITPAVL